MRCFSPICSWLPSITKNSLKEQGNNLKPFAVVPPHFGEVRLSIGGKRRDKEMGNFCHAVLFI